MTHEPYTRRASRIVAHMQENGEEYDDVRDAQRDIQALITEVQADCQNMVAMLIEQLGCWHVPLNAIAEAVNNARVLAAERERGRSAGNEGQRGVVAWADYLAGGLFGPELGGHL